MRRRGEVQSWRQLCGAAHISEGAEQVLDRPHLERSVLEEVPSDQREGRLEFAHVRLQLLCADAEALLEAGSALAGEGLHPSVVVARCDGRLGVSPCGDRWGWQAARTLLCQGSTLDVFIRCAIEGRLSELDATGDSDAHQQDESSQDHGDAAGGWQRWRARAATDHESSTSKPQVPREGRKSGRGSKKEKHRLASELVVRC